MIDITINHNLQEIIDKLNLYNINIQNAMADGAKSAEEVIKELAYREPNVSIAVSEGITNINISDGYIAPEFLPEVLESFTDAFDSSFGQLWGSE